MEEGRGMVQREVWRAREVWREREVGEGRR